MKKIKIIKVDNPDGTFDEHVIIDRGNNEFISMPKANYDALQTEQIIPIDTEDE
jgi:hypothetical protein